MQQNQNEENKEEEKETADVISIIQAAKQIMDKQLWVKAVEDLESDSRKLVEEESKYFSKYFNELIKISKDLNVTPKETESFIQMPLFDNDLVIVLAMII